MKDHEEGISLPEILVSAFLIGLIIVPLVQIFPRTLVSNVTNVDVALSTAAIRKMEEVITILRVPPVAFNASSTQQTTTSGGASSTSASITINASANYVVVLIGINSGSVAVSSVTVGTGSATRVLFGSTGSYRSELWGLLNPLTGTQTVTVTFPSAVGHSWVAASFKGVLSTTPLGTSNSANGSSTTPSVSISPRTANSLVVGGFLLAPAGATISQGTAQAAIATATTTKLATNLSTHLAIETSPGDAGTGMAWSLSASATWIALAVELRGVVSTGTPSGTAPCNDLPNCLLVWTRTTEISSTVPGAGSLKDLSVVACQDLNNDNACESGEPQVRYDSKITTHP